MVKGWWFRARSDSLSASDRARDRAVHPDDHNCRAGIFQMTQRMYIPLSVITIFLGSFLLFTVQPIIGKYIQPWFGSTSAVWSTCLMFFQGVLLLGYLYAHLLGRLRPQRQLSLHALLVALTLLIGAVHMRNWASPILPSVEVAIDSSPIPTILFLLSLSIGLSFLLLSSNSTLVQHWYAHVFPHRNAYALYAVSNGGSLLALLAYPFLVERAIGLRLQSHIWFILLILYALLILVCAALAARWQARSIVPENKPDVADPIQSDVPLKRTLFWFLLSMTGSVLLLAVTSEMTQNVAPIPFLWVVPLSVYLLTFILGFTRLFAAYRPAGPALLFAGGLMALYALNQKLVIPIGHTIAWLSGALFCVCLFCHGTLHATRPDHRHLTFFYLVIALGGFTGGFFVSIVAPLIFPAYWEIQIASCLALLLAAWQTIHVRTWPMPVRYAAAALSIAFCGLFAQTIVQELQSYVYLHRNFYGTLRVEKEIRGEGPQELRRYALKHGDIVHGLQFSRTEYRYRPVAYFSEDSGVGRAIRHHPLRDIPDHSFRIGVVGGGIGTLVAYARDGDRVRLYELNPAVQELALNTDYFTYLADYADRWSAVIGDGRWALAADLETAGTPLFDVLALDAFNGDAVPVHLLTREAFDLYLNCIDRENGVLAVNITNKHVDFRPLIRAVADEFRLNAVILDGPGDGIITIPNRWALLTRNPDMFRSPAFRAGRVSLIDAPPMRLWTDDRSSLLELMKF